MDNIKSFILLLLILIIVVLIFYYLNHQLKKKSITYENFENNSIPKIIIQTWKTKNIPEKYKEDVESVRKYNKGYQYLFFSDDDIEYFLKTYYPQYYKTYQKLPVKIQKIDFFRYIAVYHYGGFYLDLDMTALYPLDELLDYDCVFPVDQIITPNKCVRNRLKKYCSLGMNILLGQYAFGAKPQDHFVKALIDGIHNNINDYIKKYETNGKTLQYVYSTTGPDYVTDIYIDYNKKDDIHILEFDYGQYFGKYAKHNFYGTWKNKDNKK
jgi:mannosyltransferase OCH1-like enzyme